MGVACYHLEVELIFYILVGFGDKILICKRGAKIIRNFDPAKRNIAFFM